MPTLKRRSDRARSGRTATEGVEISSGKVLMASLPPREVPWMHPGSAA